MSESKHTLLAPYTSLNVGGPAERLVMVESSDQALELVHAEDFPDWILGYGTNSLISDQGLAGTTWLMHGGSLRVDGSTLIADAGVWWDDAVKRALDNNLWGLETMSGIPGSVGAAVVGNIAAYGQAVSDTLAWIEIFDTHTRNTRKIEPKELSLGYRYSNLQSDEMKRCIVLRVAFSLGKEKTKDIAYQALIDIAGDNNLNIDNLKDRRTATLIARESAESLFDFRKAQDYARTAGSFFRNPEVDAETARYVMSFDETGRSLERLQAANQVHGGSATRVSAAHVLLAAGFHRGQSWGHVRLDKKHVLKIENAGGATAQDIYDVSGEIVKTVRQKLGIELVPEVRFLGNFTPRSS